MKRAFKSGFSFGLTSGIITTLGLIVGLHSSTDSRLVVIGGILTIAVVDAFSDSLGMHMAQESQNHMSHKIVWYSTLYTFLFKFIFSSIFIIPVLIFDLRYAIIVSIIVGLYLIFLVSLIIARERKENPIKIIGEHLLIAIFVIIIAHYIGIFISNVCGQL
jgi:VIT1/CCC1 family predicted Fe2+/Mn2+ transporter